MQGPANFAVIRTLIIEGAGGGAFIYDAAGNLRIAQVGAVTTDPVHGITCQAGLSTFNTFGAVLFLQSTANDATFFYNNTGSSTQGTRILSIASASGTDPVIGTTYPAGQQGIDPAFADFITLVGANIDLGQLAFTSNAHLVALTGSGANRPRLQLDAPEQGVSGHLQMQMAGTSPDGTHLAQLLIGSVGTGGTLTPLTLALFELQGYMAMDNRPTPAAVSGASLIYGDVNGFLHMRPDAASLDTTTYQIGHALLNTSADQANITAQVTITGLSLTLAVGTYRISGVITVNNPSAGNDTPAVGISGSGGLALAGITNVNVEWYEVQTNVFKGAGQLTALGTRVGTTSAVAAGNTDYAHMDGLIEVSTAGTLNITAGLSAGTSLTVKGGSYMNYDPAN